MFIKLKKMNWLIAVLIGTLAISSCEKDRDSSKKYTVSGNASGSQVVPTVAVGGTGTISGTYDSKTRVLTYTSTWIALTGVPTSAKIYAGATGTNGSATSASFTIGLSAGNSGTTSGSVTLSNIEGAELIAGGLYYIYTTAANPSGEIRGQIVATEQ